VEDLQSAQYPSLRRDLRIGRRMIDRRGRPAIVVQDPVLKGILHRGYRVSPQLAELLSCLDGTAHVQDLPSRLRERTGIVVSLADVETLLERLERYDLLDTPTTRRKRDDLLTQFSRMPVRPSCDPNGNFYPQDASALKETMANCFAHPENALPNLGGGERTTEPPAGLILPHGAMQASGRCAARALHRFAQGPLPDLYVIIGPNHVYPGPPGAEILFHPFETPLGKVEVNQDAGAALMTLANGAITSGALGHFRDHSVEVVLPFLQWVHEQCPARPQSKANFQIVPLLLTGERHRPGSLEPEGHRQVWCQLAGALDRFLQYWPRSVTVVASGDFTHWGHLFDFTPFDARTDHDFFNWDRPLLEAMAAGDPDRVLAAWRPTNCCAGRPVYVALQALRGTCWSLVDYHVAWDDDLAISFASYVTESPQLPATQQVDSLHYPA
jgi:AmmeMemoRadiSam system protein B